MFRSNKLNVVISIVAAIAIWVYVVTFINPVTEKTVRSVSVNLINLEALTQNGLTVSPNQAFAVDVVVKGARAELNKIDAADLIATADMTGFPAGKNTVDVEVTVPNNIELMELHPAKIEVLVEELVSVTKPVTLEYAGKKEAGMEPGFITLSPREISVSGTKEIIDSVDTVKVQVDTDALTGEEKTITAKAEAYTKSGESVYGVTYSQNEIDVTARMCYTKEVPLKLNVTGKPAKGRGITSIDVPQTVTIRGGEMAIASISEVVGRDISVEGIKETTIFSADLDLPKNVELADASRDLSVIVEIGGIEAKNLSLTADMIKIIGLPKDYTAYITTGDISVTVYGPRDQIKNLTSASILAYIDLSKTTLTDGTIDAVVLFEDDEHWVKIESVPAEVKVTVAKANSVGTTAKQTSTLGRER